MHRLKGHKPRVSFFTISGTAASLIYISGPKTLARAFEGSHGSLDDLAFACSTHSGGQKEIVNRRSSPDVSTESIEGVFSEADPRRFRLNRGGLRMHSDEQTLGIEISRGVVAHKVLAPTPAVIGPGLVAGDVSSWLQPLTENLQGLRSVLRRLN